MSWNAAMVTPAFWTLGTVVIVTSADVANGGLSIVLIGSFAFELSFVFAFSFAFGVSFGFYPSLDLMAAVPPSAHSADLHHVEVVLGPSLYRVLTWSCNNCPRCLGLLDSLEHLNMAIVDTTGDFLRPH